MHVPDGLLNPLTCCATGMISTATVAYALHRVRSDLPPRTVPLMGVTAACLFAAQMVNFPIPGGTSGHLLGGLLAATLLGPWAGLIVMTIVLFVQCLLFQDGGITALGANILNLGVAGSIAGYAIYSLIRRTVGGMRGTLAAGIIGAWFSVQIGAVLCSLELCAGGDFRFTPTLAVMLLFHSLIGLGESLATGLAMAWILRVRPDLIYGQTPTKNLATRTSELMIAGTSIALILAALVSPFASTSPDGLEAAVQRSGFDLSQLTSFWPSPFADYRVSSLEPFGIAGSAAGLIGAFAAMALAISMAWQFPRRPALSHMANRNHPSIEG